MSRWLVEVNLMRYMFRALLSMAVLYVFWPFQRQSSESFGYPFFHFALFAFLSSRVHFDERQDIFEVSQIMRRE